MADVLKNLVVPQKLAHIRPRRHKHDSSEPSSRKYDINMIHLNQVVANPSKEEVTNQIYPLTVKRLQMLTMHMLHSKHLFKCNAIIDNSYDFNLLKTKMQQRRPKIVILRPLQWRAIAP